MHWLSLLHVSPQQLVRTSLLPEETPVVVQCARQREQELEVTLSILFFFEVRQHLHVFVAHLEIAIDRSLCLVSYKTKTVSTLSTIRDLPKILEEWANRQPLILIVRVPLSVGASTLTVHTRAAYY